MAGVKQLLDVCRARGVYLTDGIKRAIFWYSEPHMQLPPLIEPSIYVQNRQDLNSSVLTGSSRLFSHTTMTEMQWTRDVVSYQDWFTLPPGFERLSHLFPRDFFEVIEDVHTLQHMRDAPYFICQDTIAMLHVDNHQAWVCSRLQQLLAQPERTSSAVVECCYYAVYLSSTMLCCKVWRKSPIPVSEVIPAISMSMCVIHKTDQY